MQGELKLVGEIDSTVIDLPWDLIAMCDTVQAAYRLCINRSRVYRSHDDLAELLGFKQRGTLNNIINSDHSDRVRHLGRVREIKLQQVCFNNAVDQWADLYAKGQLNCQKSIATREAELMKQLEELRARA